MKIKMALLVITIILALLFLPSCSTIRSFNVDISCDQFTENPNWVISSMLVNTEDTITVELCSNATTGFEWDYVMTTDSVLKEEAHEFVAPNDDLPGAAGKEIWTFEAVEKGTTEIQMEYSQPWEGGLKAEWTCTLTITVN